MRKATIDLFNYDELPATAQAKARDWYRAASAGDMYYSETVIDEAVDIAKMLGISLDRDRDDKPAISWSGFCSQGDGACFTGRWAFIANLAEVRRYAPQDLRLHGIAHALETHGQGLRAAVRQSGRYFHARSMIVDVETMDGESPSSDAAREVTEALRAFADWIYWQLELAWEDSNSDEEVAETIRANEYEFTAMGKRAPSGI